MKMSSDDGTTLLAIYKDGLSLKELAHERSKLSFSETELVLRKCSHVENSYAIYNA